MNILPKLFGPKNPEELLEKAIQAFRNKEFERARGLLDQGVKFFPGIARIIFWHGILNLSITDLKTILDHPMTGSAAADMSRAVALYERDQAGLNQDELIVAYITCFRFALEQEDFQQAIGICDKVLSLYPTDDYFLPKLVSALAQSNRDPKQIEKWSRRALDLHPEMAEIRKTWKKARKSQSKNFFSDRPENEKRAIYLLYAETKNNAFFEALEGMDILSTNVPNLAEHAKRISECSQVGAQAGSQAVRKKYHLTAFELELINQEGETENWSVGRAAVRKGGGSVVQMRDNLSCVHCHQSFPAPYWPPAGNGTAFYYESAERVKEAPGKFRLPVKCPHCGTTWYVVWDEIPGDPIGQHFLHHF
jgi:tetratricopeptide (TPR) repeat protein